MDNPIIITVEDILAHVQLTGKTFVSPEGHVFHGLTDEEHAEMTQITIRPPAPKPQFVQPKWSEAGYCFNANDIVGKTVVHVRQDDDQITFWFDDGTVCRWYDEQYCCEEVHVEDVNGDWSDMIGHPLLVADERSYVTENEDEGERVTWTFYTFRTVAGSVDVRWHGSSNGYYSESVDFELYDPAATPDPS